MKTLVSMPVGGDGGSVALGVDGKDLALSVRYPMAKALEPVKALFVDKLKAIIPGTWDDMLIDKAWSEALELLDDTKPPVIPV